MSPPAPGTATGWVPAPRDPVEAARLALARSAMRGTPVLDQITFVAGCPCCGADCEWLEQRVETRLLVQIDCRCTG